MKYRLPATIIGCSVFFILFEYVIPDAMHGAVAVLTGFGVMFINSYFRKTIANSLLYTTGGAVVFRILSNAIGVGVAIISHHAFEKIFDRIAVENKGVITE